MWTAQDVERDVSKPEGIAKTATNLIVRRSDGKSYCIQYVHKSDDKSRTDVSQFANGTRLQATDMMLELHVGIFQNACPSGNIKNLHTLNHDKIEAKETSKERLLSGSFKYTGNCQAALTDAASVSKATSAKPNLNFNDRLIVILVVTLPALFLYFLPA